MDKRWTESYGQEDTKTYGDEYDVHRVTLNDYTLQEWKVDDDSWELHTV